MPELTFVDTNVLDASDARRSAIARDLLHRLWDARAGRLSLQVLQEFYVVATQKLSPPVDAATARQVLHAYGAWLAAPPDMELLLDASTLAEAAGLSWWDALIVAAAGRAGAGNAGERGPPGRRGDRGRPDREPVRLSRGVRLEAGGSKCERRCNEARAPCGVVPLAERPRMGDTVGQRGACVPTGLGA